MTDRTIMRKFLRSQDGTVVGILDKIYDIEGDTVTFDSIEVRGDLSGELYYEGWGLYIDFVRTEVGPQCESRREFWKGVRCTIFGMDPSRRERRVRWLKSREKELQGELFSVKDELWRLFAEGGDEEGNTDDPGK